MLLNPIFRLTSRNARKSGKQVILGWATSFRSGKANPLALMITMCIKT